MYIYIYTHTYMFEEFKEYIASTHNAALTLRLSAFLFCFLMVQAVAAHIRGSTPHEEMED